MARLTNEQKKEKIRNRVRAQLDPTRYEFYPETVSNDHYYKGDEYQRVAIYARVSTDDPMQTTSYELQQKHYTELVMQHPLWELVDIYADEGISGTSTAHRTNFLRMMKDADDGKIDLIITKSVSRFARNVEDFLKSIRTLAEHTPRIGVFFEAENIYSLKEDSKMALSFQATMAEEESRNKSRSMEISLRMRLDHGLPLTPKLLGFTQNEDGKLIPDPETYNIPKLMFSMCLLGYSTQQIADTLVALGKKTYLGNDKWTATGVVRTLRNERYCGDVFTRKTFTPDVVSHRSIKNRGERPRSKYLDEHDAIVSRDDYIAVQHILNNSKYRNKSILPELKVIDNGLLKGYVIINPRWGAFTPADYIAASSSVCTDEVTKPQYYQAKKGDFNFEGYEVTYLGLLDTRNALCMSIDEKQITFSKECLRRMKTDTYVELLVHPLEHKLAVRPTHRENRNAVAWSKTRYGKTEVRSIPCTAFVQTLFALLGWDISNKYRLIGSMFRNGEEAVCVFCADMADVFLNRNSEVKSDRGKEVTQEKKQSESEEKFMPVIKSGKRIGVLPEKLSIGFGNCYYAELAMSDLYTQTKEQWQLRIEGQFVKIGTPLAITPYEELKAFVQSEIGDLQIEEENAHADE